MKNENPWTWRIVAMAESAIKISEALNSEVATQAQKRHALEMAVEALGYMPNYSGGNGAVRCDLLQLKTVVESQPSK